MAGHPFTVSTINADPDDGDSMDMSTSIKAVETLLRYNFKDKNLLEKALTHSSYTESESYQRLEFVGDAAIGLAISNFIFLTYPDCDPGDLTLLRSVNISTEKLARVAVRHGLYRYVRHSTSAMNEKVREFCVIVEQEDDTVVHGGAMKAPKVLADIVESVAAAVYFDVGFNLQAMWVIVRGLLEPLITLDVLHQQPQPVTLLFEVCQKDGKQVDIRHWRKGDKNIASVYVDGKFIVSASSEQKENAKLHAAKAALQKLPHHITNGKLDHDIFFGLDGASEIEAPKQKLHEVCGKKKWPKPVYSVEKEVGPAHERKFLCSVKFEIPDGLVFVEGEEKSRIKDAENSAASMMLRGLREHNYL